MAAKAWGGRFQQATDPRVEKFTESISFDHRLAQVDIRGSQAHARMLARVGLITDDECEQIVRTLDAIGGEIERGELPFRVELEDIHMHIESALIERLGDTGRKLNTARTGNDQVATDLKLYIREAIERIDSQLRRLQAAVRTARLHALVRRAQDRHERHLVLITGDVFLWATVLAGAASAT
jgi:argininosuccinate lyase